jgi:hypothetical protein
MIDEISLVGVRTLINVIDNRLKCIHIPNRLFGGLDFIVTCDVYQKYCWIFQNIKDNVNAPNVQCYELNEVM